MRRILITPIIENVATDYATNVFNGARKTPERNLKVLYDWLKKDRTVCPAQLEYVSRLETDMQSLMKAKPREMRKYINRYDKLLRNGGGIDVLLNQSFTKGGKTSPFKEWVQEALRYDDYIREHIVPYIRKIDIRTCVYCNAQYALTIDSAGRTRAMYQFDHFYSKSRYPMLSISFFNLQPCCSSCNTSKNNRRARFNLYVEDPHQANSPYIFQLEKKSILEYKLKRKALKILFDAPNDKKLLNNTERLFHISELYASLTDVAGELIWKACAWNKSYLSQLLFKNKSLDKNLLNRVLYGFYTEEKDILKRPLTKFQQDIARQLGILK